MKINLELTGTAPKRMKKLQALSGADSSVDVIRNALKLYGWALEEHVKGTSFLIEKANGDLYEVTLFEEK